MAVPSSSTTNYYKSIAAMYAANGYIVVMIDYVGEGGGSAFQPYVLFPHDNVQTGIKAVESVMDELLNDFPKIKGFPVTATGYSEGAAFALFFANCAFNGCGGYELAKFSVERVYGMEGAYDLQNTTYGFLMQNVTKKDNNKYEIETLAITNELKPSLMSLTILGFLEYSKKRWVTSEVFNESFYSMICTTKTKILENQTHCQYNGISRDLKTFLTLPYVKQQVMTSTILNSAFSKSINEIYFMDKNVLEWVDSTDNSMKTLIKNTFLIDSEFIKQMTLATFKSFVPSIMRVFTYDKDSVVSPKNTKSLTSEENIQIVKNEKLKVCTLGVPEPVDHLRGEIFANFFALKYLETGK